MTLSEENYLKAIYHLTTLGGTEVSTNAIAEKMETKASSVTDMLRKLAEKELIHYKKYQGVSLTQTGRLAAKMIVRKHRLWEVFLVEKLAFAWDEVHDIAEQLEHIQSPELVDRLDDFLGNPTEDPHGDPIPDREGRILKTEKQLVSELAEGQEGVCVGVRDTSSEFLQYLDKNSIALGAHITIVGREPFDGSLAIRVDGALHSISGKVAANLFVKPV
ncbi:MULTISPECIES: metal-dependent transcriptional regulator [unclassified Flavobacterium]|uniref:metal-dependent transcriptional regulator n=1 Tax=unclassified Flavobacterium TaxID=196869 RepID=UPI001F12DA03|nr:MULTISPECIES: metal-dependent transcriptional regulator [unclassified Flavobacterium]UMY66536.1 metal-dependent transcriptional regulator [Flavobacterium sp. HJ-32-4]